MTASPELRRPATPEFLLRPIATLTPVENHSRIQLSSSLEDGEECHTPTSVDSKIPAISSCPPAPKKRRRVVVLCRKRLIESESFKVAPKEIECFFRCRKDSMIKPRLTTASQTNKKRKRPCTDEQ